MKFYCCGKLENNLSYSALQFEHGIYRENGSNNSFLVYFKNLLETNKVSNMNSRVYTIPTY